MTQKHRDIKRKLAVLEHAKQSGNVAKTCRHFGILELELVGQVRAFDLAVQVRAPRLDVDVPHPLDHVLVTGERQVGEPPLTLQSLAQRALEPRRAGEAILGKAMS